MKQIPLINKPGMFVIVDDGDYEYLSQFTWALYESCKYPSRTSHGKTILLHHEVLQRRGVSLHNGVEADHVDRNRLNASASNLRLATRAQNNLNKEKNKNNSSGYKGVSWHAIRHKWRAQIGVGYKQVYLGLFDSPIDAAKAYDRAAFYYFGDYAKLNFPNDKANLAIRFVPTEKVKAKASIVKSFAAFDISPFDQFDNENQTP